MKNETSERRADDIHALLDAADPLRHEPELSASDSARMRQALMSAMPQAAPAIAWWPRALAAAALVVLMVIAGTVSNRDKARKVESGDATKVAVPIDPPERRQLQFATPGGTRIIWTLDPEFKLEGVAP